MKYVWEKSDVKGGMKVEMYGIKYMVGVVNFCDSRGDLYAFVNLETGRIFPLDGETKGMSGEGAAEHLTEARAKPL